MKKNLDFLLLFFVMSLFGLLKAHAIELVRWELIPLPITLHVNQERIVLVEKNVRVGFPAALNGKLRIQTTGGAVYLRAASEFPSTRLQLQDIESGEILLLDVSSKTDNAVLEPVRIIYSGDVTSQNSRQMVKQSADLVNEKRHLKRQKPRYHSPLPVLLTRYAAQNLYAPLRTVEALAGVQTLALPLAKEINTLYPNEALSITPLAGWRVAEYKVVALKLTNQSTTKLVLDPLRLQGQFITATFQHQWLGSAGSAEDTTTLYLVVKGKVENAFIPEATQEIISKPLSRKVLGRSSS